MFRILDAIVGGAHWINSISEIVFELMKIQLTETNPKLGDTLALLDHVVFNSYIYVYIYI